MELFTKEMFKGIWDRKPKVVVDANVLLHLYRYSTDSSKAILFVFEQIIDYVWIPQQALTEYKRNKQNVINTENDKYGRLNKDLKGIINKIESELSKQFFQYKKFGFSNVKDLESKMNQDFTEIEKDVEEFFIGTKLKSSERSAFLREDKIEKFVQNIEQKGHCGDAFTIHELIDIYRMGHIRYRHMIPPGYMDVDKDKDDETKTRKFGDLIFWMQIIKMAVCEEKDILLVTAEEKEDWWSRAGGSENKSLTAPRKELTDEFEQETKNGNRFNMITLPEFYTHVSQIIEVDNQASIRAQLEIKAMNDVSKELECSWHRAIEQTVREFLENEGFSDVALVADTARDVDYIEYSSSDSLEISDVNIELLGNEAIYSMLGSIHTYVEVFTRFEREDYSMGTILLEVALEMTVSRNVDFIKGIIEDFNDNLKINNISIEDGKSLEHLEHDGHCVFCGSIDPQYICSEGYVCEDCSNERAKPCVNCLDNYPIHEINENGLCPTCADRTDFL